MPYPPGGYQALTAWATKVTLGDEGGGGSGKGCRRLGPSPGHTRVRGGRRLPQPARSGNTSPETDTQIGSSGGSDTCRRIRGGGSWRGGRRANNSLPVLPQTTPTVFQTPPPPGGSAGRSYYDPSQEEGLIHYPLPPAYRNTWWYWWVHCKGRAAGEGNGLGGLFWKEERMGILFWPGRGGPPGLPPPKVVPEQGGSCVFYRTVAHRGTEEGIPVQGPTPIHDGARPLFVGEFCFNGWQGSVGSFAILGD